VIVLKQKGDFKKTEKFLRTRRDFRSILEKYAKQGVIALSSATPVDTGQTAASWGYVIEDEDGRLAITWTNDNIIKGVNIAIIIQYGHGTRNGGYVAGRDYINPAIRPVFDKISQELWKEVRKS